MSTALTIEQFERALPKRMKKTLNPALIKDINNIIADPVFRDSFKENLLSYTSVMNNGTWKVQSYIEAVKYVSHKLLGSTNIEAYTKTFPERYKRFVDKGLSSRDIASYVSSYNKNKLVNLIFEQTLVPSHVLNAGMYQDALNVQANLMINANSEKVRTDAANSLLNHLKMPETQKIELDIAVKEDKSINELRATTMELVAQQKKMIEAGAMTAKETAHSKLVVVDGESEVIDVN